jgi:hypothetical protein
MPLQVRPNQTREGPWVDRLFPVTLPGGRVCSVTGFYVVPAYLGLMEGGLDARCNAARREWVAALARERFGEPVHVVEPAIEPLPEISNAHRQRERLPWMACMAVLEAEPMNPEAFHSSLTIVWWVDAFSSPLPAEVERAAAGVAWEREARDRGVGRSHGE